MTNMGYCRFHNALIDLRDCYDHLFDDDLSEEESQDRQRLIALCETIAEDYGSEADDWR